MIYSVLPTFCCVCMLRAIHKETGSTLLCPPIRSMNKTNILPGIFGTLFRIYRDIRLQALTPSAESRLPTVFHSAESKHIKKSLRSDGQFLILKLEKRWRILIWTYDFKGIIARIFSWECPFKQYHCLKMRGKAWANITLFRLSIMFTHSFRI
jgi:hypothetical protein